jgi:group I intron endonuclease
MGLIYCATNNHNDKVYIGKTDRSLEERRKDHEQAALKPVGYKYVFQYALKKHGLNNFSWKVLAYADDPNQLNELERYYIALAQSLDRRYGYNRAAGGTGGRMAPEVCKATGLKLRGRQSPLRGQPGHSQTKETRIKISINSASRGQPGTMLGKHHSIKTIQRFKIVHANQAPNKGRIGKKNSDEHNQAIKTAAAKKRHQRWIDEL